MTDCANLKDSTDVVSRSIKEKYGDFEISFESNFMDEHLAAFRVYSKNLMERSLKTENLPELTFSNFSIFGLG